MTSACAGEMLSQHLKTLYLWSLSKTRDTYEAEELCSETVLAVISSAPNLRNDDAFFGFLWQTASNTFKVHLRKNKRNKCTILNENSSDDEDFADGIFDSQQANILRREISLLSDEYRKCTVAFYYNKLSCSEIAEKYGITVEMVKYYLFKSRKILKEGIAMERQFGEKSFNPSEFRFRTLYFGRGNKEFDTLFNRKLTGQILLSAYYEPMDVLQMSIELGVASVYLEDEIQLLTDYKLLKKIGTKKYQTDVIVIGKEYTDALYNKLDSDYADKIFEIIDGVRKKLPEIRKIDFSGSQIKENLLLWDIYVRLIMLAVDMPKIMSDWKNIYSSTTGISYVYDHDENEEKYVLQSFVYQNTSIKGYNSSLIGFGVLKDRVKNFIFDNSSIPEIESGKFFPVITQQEIVALDEIIKDETEQMKSLLSKISERSVDLLLEYSPTGMREQIMKSYPQINLIDIGGWYGGAALNTNALQLPENGEYAGIIVYKC